MKSRAGDPSHIGRFRLLSRLGEGGMGRVYLGASPGNRKVAIKVVHPRHASDPEFRRRFSYEVRAARQVGGFHTAAVVDADPDANPPWMETAYIPGPSLADDGPRIIDFGIARPPTPAPLSPLSPGPTSSSAHFATCRLSSSTASP